MVLWRWYFSVGWKETLSICSLDWYQVKIGWFLPFQVACTRDTVLSKDTIKTLFSSSRISSPPILLFSPYSFEVTRHLARILKRREPSGKMHLPVEASPDLSYLQSLHRYTKLYARFQHTAFYFKKKKWSIINKQFDASLMDYASLNAAIIGQVMKQES